MGNWDSSPDSPTLHSSVTAFLILLYSQYLSKTEVYVFIPDCKSTSYSPPWMPFSHIFSLDFKWNIALISTNWSEFISERNPMAHHCTNGSGSHYVSKSWLLIRAPVLCHRLLSLHFIFPPHLQCPCIPLQINVPLRVSKQKFWRNSISLPLPHSLYPFSSFLLVIDLSPHHFSSGLSLSPPSYLLPGPPAISYSSISSINMIQ